MTEHLGATLPAPVSTPDDLRSVMRMFPTGVTVLSSGQDEEASAITVNSFTSVSLDPPRVLVSVMKSSRTHPVIDATGGFHVHLLSDRQEDVARLFASRNKPSGRELQNYLAAGKGESLFMPGALATLDCRVEGRFPGGDHTLFLGRVESVQPGADAEGALLFHRGRLTSAPTFAE
ncbi:flavin reductase family protein [Streptomyces sp. NPDC056149]|uniref:flavin reductase family protein n=1 Tax=Streptomyces sp. NPDC056149 TaxID=3345728 RepID=UPI0035E1BA39